MSKNDACVRRLEEEKIVVKGERKNREKLKAGTVPSKQQVRKEEEEEDGSLRSESVSFIESAEKRESWERRERMD